MSPSWTSLWRSDRILQLNFWSQGSEYCVQFTTNKIEAYGVLSRASALFGFSGRGIESPFSGFIVSAGLLFPAAATIVHLNFQPLYALIAVDSRFPEELDVTNERH